MKKSVTIIFLALLLLTSFAIAQEPEATDKQADDTPQSLEAQNIEELGETFQEEFKKQREQNATEWSQKTELPEFFQAPTKFLFNIEEDEEYETLYLEDAIVFLMVIFMFFLIVHQALSFIGVIKEGPIRILTAVAISVLGSIFGGMTYLATLYINFVSATGTLANLPLWQNMAGTRWRGIIVYGFLIIVAIVLWYFLDAIKAGFHRSNVKEAAEVKSRILKDSMKKVQATAKAETN